MSVDCTYIKSMNGISWKKFTDRGRRNKLSVIVDLIGVSVGYYLEKANISDCKLLRGTFKNKIYEKM